jgi:hypothetical protein
MALTPRARTACRGRTDVAADELASLGFPDPRRPLAADTDSGHCAVTEGRSLLFAAIGGAPPARAPPPHTPPPTPHTHPTHTAHPTTTTTTPPHALRWDSDKRPPQKKKTPPAPGVAVGESVIKCPSYPTTHPRRRIYSWPGMVERFCLEPTTVLRARGRARVGGGVSCQPAVQLRKRQRIVYSAQTVCC